jgi:hypothetical protein
MNAEKDEPRSPITEARARQLDAYAVHYANQLIGPPDNFSLSETLVILATATGVALCGVVEEQDRRRLLQFFTRLALKKAREESSGILE